MVVLYTILLATGVALKSVSASLDVLGHSPTQFCVKQNLIKIDSMSICASIHFSACYARFTRKRLNRLSRNCVSLNAQRVASFSVENNGGGEPYMRNGGVNFFTEYDHAGYQTKDLN